MMNQADCLHKFKIMNLSAVISAARITLHYIPEVLVLGTM